MSILSLITLLLRKPFGSCIIWNQWYAYEELLIQISNTKVTSCNKADELLIHVWVM